MLSDTIQTCSKVINDPIMRRSLMGEMKLATYLGYFSPTSDELSLDSNKFLQYSSVLTQLAQLKLNAQVRYI